jgi:hypothetical protein
MHQFDLSICRHLQSCTGRSYPTKGIRAFRESRRERFLNSDELARLGGAIREAETVGIPYEVDETKPTSKHAPKAENRRIRIDEYTASPHPEPVVTAAE